jgi:UDP:flavonoid glycosyltransferase YjiC (YdhE family)
MPERPTFLILPFHGIGHFNAFFGVARALQKTHRVIFAGTAYFHRHVTSRGFEYRILASYPFGLGLEGWIHETVKRSKHPLLKNIADRWKDTLYHERKAELTNVLREINPIHVLIDAQQATDVVVVKAIDPSLRISVVNTAPPYLLLPGLPPINSLAMPGDDDTELNRSLQTIRAKVWRQKRKYFGLDDRTMVDRRLRRNRMTHLKDVYPSLITLAVKDVDQYVLTYKEFDFHHEYLDRYRYVGPHLDAEYQEPRADEFLKQIEKAKSDGKKLAYCSFGTVPSTRDLSSFLQKVNGLNYSVIMASRSSFVPQQTVLAHADVFITHGGINSIHDAIRHQVPMIVYPLDKNYDQQGNSSRVVYHKLGLRGDIDTDTIDDIKNKLDALPPLKENFDKFSQLSYSTENFIQQLL